MNSEAKKFNAFGKEWWDPNGRFVSLHRINPLRYGYFVEKGGDPKGRTLLDVGCGGGILSEEFAKGGAEVTAIDLSPVSINAAKEHAAESGLEIDYRVTPVEEVEGEFDIVVCAEVLEHVDHLETFIGNCAARLKEGGHFFFSTLNKTLLSRFLAIFMAEDILGMVPRGTHEYERFIKPSDLVRLFRGGGIDVKEVRGMVYDPFILDFRIGRSTSVNYLGYGVKEKKV